jgi:hypothetical protein
MCMTIVVWTELQPFSFIYTPLVSLQLLSLSMLESRLIHSNLYIALIYALRLALLPYNPVELIQSHLPLALPCSIVYF